MTPNKDKTSAAARRWWKSLQPAPDGKWPGDRAALAKLRRASDSWSAATEPATLALYRALYSEAPTNDDKLKAEQLTRVAVIASVLAHVRKDDASETIARAAGPPRGAKNGEGAILKPLRLARLMAARDDEEIATAFRRLVAQLDAANVGDLAWLMLAWDRGEFGDRIRTLFAFDYHDATAHAPSEPDGAGSSPSTPSV